MVKNPPANAGDIRDPVLTPGLGRSPGEGNGNPFQYSYFHTPVFLLPYSSILTPILQYGKSHGWESLAAHCPWGHRVGHD